MDKITFEVLTGHEIEECRDLCNELMAFQKSRAIIYPESFDEMNFDTRMKLSYEQALRKFVAIAKDDKKPVGYVFATVDHILPVARETLPAWAPKDESSKGFYPDWLELPQLVGCLNNIYLRGDYQGQGLGVQLLKLGIGWLNEFDDVKNISVFISNGNKKALEFYLKHGFEYSHEVFNGFISAAYLKKI